VAKGKLVAEADGPVLEASELMAKCPSKYEESKRKRGPVQVTPAASAAGSSAASSGRAPEPGQAASAPSSR
jgi:hypothetical protein